MQSLLHGLRSVEAENLQELNQLEMPTLYSSIENEFDAATNGVAMVDRSWLGRIEVTGTDRVDLLHRLSTNDLLAAKPGVILPTVFTTDKGRIIDYVSVLIRESSLLLITSPTNEERFKSWIDKYTIMEDIQLDVVTRSTAQLSLIGPKAKQVVESIIGNSISLNEFTEIEFSGWKSTVAYRNDFDTEMVDIIADAECTREIWEVLSARDAGLGIVKMGKRGYNSFRISRGMPSAGTELVERFNPYEVGLRHAISYTKGCYIGQEVIARLDTYQKIQRDAVGIVLDSSSEPASAGSLVLQQGEELGLVTSVSEESIRGKCAAIAVVKKGAASTDDRISVVSEGQTVAGVVRLFPVKL